jgi:prolyl-tRNA synthetase
VVAAAASYQLDTAAAIHIHAGKWARGGWAGSDEQEKQVKEETQATIRCFPFEQPAGLHTCLMTGKPADEVAIFAKSY